MAAGKPDQPYINYMAKDYDSFRQMMIDHLLRRTDWTGDNAADMGMVLVELLAQAADYASYYQDAVATEAYLNTARLRRSVERHLRLLDYTLHQGCNARVWVHVHLKENAPDEAVYIPPGTPLLTRPVQGAFDTVIEPNSPAYGEALAVRPIIFETVRGTTLFRQHNAIYLQAISGEQILRTGATSAYIYGTDREGAPAPVAYLRPGDVLLLEMAAPGFDSLAHIIRLIRVERSGARRDDGTPLTRIQWAFDDALPRDIPIGVLNNGDPASILRGNLIMADHGRTILAESLPPVPEAVSARYRPDLSRPGLTFAAPFSETAGLSAADMLRQNPQDAVPALKLLSGHPSQTLHNTPLPLAHQHEAIRDLFERFALVLTDNIESDSLSADLLLVRDLGKSEQYIVERLMDGTFTIYGDGGWQVKRDLLNSDPFSGHFSVEMEEDGRARLRFGFGGVGRSPEAGGRYMAQYRIGSGTAGNIGPQTLRHMIIGFETGQHIEHLYNPLPAVGGTDPESLESARLSAPFAHTVQARCITPDDYRQTAIRHPLITDAAVEFRQMAGRTMAMITVLRRDGHRVDVPLMVDVERMMEPYRTIGTDLAIRAPRYISLVLQIHVVLRKGAYREPVRQAMLSAFDTQTGFFRADRFRLGQAVYLSEVVAAADDVSGVERVRVDAFHRTDQVTTPDQPADVIRIGPREVIGIETLPGSSIPRHLSISLEGGR